MSTLEGFADVASIISVGMTAVPVVERLLGKYWSKHPGTQYYKWVPKVDEILEKVIPLIEVAPAAHTLGFLRAFGLFIQSKRRLEHHLKTSRGVWQRYFKGYSVSKTYAKRGRETTRQGLRLSHQCLLLDTVKAIAGRHADVNSSDFSLETLEGLCKRSPQSRKELENFCKIVTLELGITIKISFLLAIEGTCHGEFEEADIGKANPGEPLTDPFQNEVGIEDRESGLRPADERSPDQSMSPESTTAAFTHSLVTDDDDQQDFDEGLEMDIGHISSESYENIALEVVAMDASMNAMGQQLEVLTRYLTQQDSPA